MDPGSKAPKLAPIEILERICGVHFVSGKLTVQKQKANARFQPCGLILKLLCINIPSYASMFVLFIVGKPADKKDDIDVVHTMYVSLYTNAVDTLKHAKRRKPVVSKALGY